MSEFEQFPGFSTTSVSDGTFRLSWDNIHERMCIEFIKTGIYVSIHLNRKKAEDAGYELIRLANPQKGLE